MAQKEQVLFDIHTHGVNVQTRDIYLHSYFTEEGDGAEPGVEYRQATTFIKNIQFLDKAPFKSILVHMQSPGGCWDNGMAMFNAVQFCKSYVTMLAYAQASSMSGILLQSAPLRIMMPDCHFMMHHGWSGGGIVHPFSLKNEADMQIKACQRMIQIFADRALVGPFFKKKKSATVTTAYNFFDTTIKKKVDWYLDAEEAVFYGLADCILGGNEYADIHALRD